MTRREDWPKWCDDDAFAAALEIADEARDTSKNINVEGVILWRVHPQAQPAGQWRTLALASSYHAAYAVAFAHRGLEILLLYSESMTTPPSSWVSIWPELEQ